MHSQGLNKVRVLGRRTGLVFFAVIFCFSVQAQSVLRITQTSFGRTRITELYPHTQIKYRIKGSGYKTAELLAMRDSLLFFTSGDTVLLGNLRGLKIPDHRYSLKPLQGYLLFAGLVLVPLSTLNQVITGRDVHVTPPLIIVSASLVSAGLIAAFFRTKRIHVGKYTVLQVLQFDHGNMAPASKEKKQGD